MEAGWSAVSYLTERERLTVSTMLSQMVRPIQWLLTVAEGDARSILCVDLAQELEACKPDLVQTSVRWQDTPPYSNVVHGEHREYYQQWVLADERGVAAGIHFLGLPTGYQFATLLNAMIDVSRSRVLVEPKTYLWCQRLTSPVDLLVMVTPTCPHSPRMVTLAERLALANRERIQTVIVDASTHPAWAEDLGVREVPWLRASSQAVLGPGLVVLGTVSERCLVEQLRAWQEYKLPEKRAGGADANF